MSLALLAIMQDEAPLVERWVEHLRRAPNAFDEIVVVDGGSTDGTPEALEALGVRVVRHPFNNDFAQQRNFALSLVSTEWNFFLDADELLSAPLLHGLREISRNAAEARVDSVGVARLNFHDRQMVAGPGYRGLDYQYRLNRKHCYWVGAVHEVARGLSPRIEIEVLDGHFIMHSKTQVRHEERNALYRSLE